MGDEPAPSKKARIAAPLDHHERFNYCRTRPKYRAGRNLTAVKVTYSFYQINSKNYLRNVCNPSTLCMKF